MIWVTERAKLRTDVTLKTWCFAWLAKVALSFIKASFAFLDTGSVFKIEACFEFLIKGAAHTAC